MTIKVSKFTLAGLFTMGLLTMGLTACGNTEHKGDHQDDRKDGTRHETSHNEKPVIETGHDDDHTKQNDDTTTMRQADSHVHGDALLALALDGNTLVIELESPLYNLVGFERAPQSDAEKARLTQAQDALSNSSNLFSFNQDAGCKTDRNDSVSLLADDHHDEDHGHKEEDHQDILLDYIFTCRAPNKLTAMTTTLFNHFPEMSELDTVYLGPATQIQSTLKPGKNTLKLTK